MSLPTLALPKDGLKRVILKNINPVVSSGKYPAKAAIGYPIAFSAVLFADGHDSVAARLLIREPGSTEAKEHQLQLLHNDLWTLSYTPASTGTLEFRVEAWVSGITSWKKNFENKRNAGFPVELERQQGRILLEDALPYAGKEGRLLIRSLLHQTANTGIIPEDISEELYEILVKSVPKSVITKSEAYTINVERERAQFSTWYELFPRSCAVSPGRHGTFRDVIRQLPRLSSAGFDVLYLPPIHPIGRVKRKGKNNSLIAEPEDPGSPWAIGSTEGGHTAIHPELGTMAEFQELLKEAGRYNMEIAMDLAFQCAPDHPYVREHPEWFRWRADKTVQFAENPAKKYEDILPFNFESEAWTSLWSELYQVLVFWIKRGVTIFRVDNPHTKSLKFWEWLIAAIKKEYPAIIFLAEAFTRPNIMQHLAMTGFTQSYTYFTWRNTKKEIQEYLEELTLGPMQHYFRPNFWPNTPDILPPELVTGGENASIIRFILAATLSSSYGIYGPVYERTVLKASPGKEEYENSEKYEIKYWEPLETDTRLWEMIKQVNKVRKNYTALQVTNNITFLNTSNEQIIAYLKKDEEGEKNLLIIVNLDPRHTQSGWVQLPMTLTKYGPAYFIKDQLTGEQYHWEKEWNYVELNPDHKPAHLFTLNDPTEA